uniref:hypothetical protein n=1 Tax=Cereibacter sphaeroides TaxID=1063 RepID=UPI002F94CDF1
MWPATGRRPRRSDGSRGGARSPFRRWQIWRAARAGDLLALRRATEEEALDRPAARAALERAIYGPPPQPFDARAFLRTLRRKA